MENESHKITLDGRRELNKMNLDSFTMHFENWFESSANDAFKKLHAEIVNAKIEQNEWERIKKEEPIRYKELWEEADRGEIDLDRQIVEYDFDNYYRLEELWALLEMKIIYLYKSFEINLKQLFRGAYPNVSTRSFYRWESIVQFLKEKKINISKVSGYTELLEIKNLNNSFKHSNSIEQKIKDNTIEFESENVDYIQLEKWYRRVSIYPKIFLTDLSSKIFDQLYEFNDDKINAINREIVLRMEKSDALSLINKLKKAYNRVDGRTSGS